MRPAFVEDFASNSTVLGATVASAGVSVAVYVPVARLFLKVRVLVL